MLLLVHPLFSFYPQKRSTKSEISGLIERFCKENEERDCVSSNIYNIFNFFISLFHKFKYWWGTTKYNRTRLRFHETYFYAIKNEKPYEQPNPWTLK